MLRRLILLGWLALMGGCAWAPGVYVEQGDFDEAEEAQGEPLPITLRPITHELIQKRALAAAAAAGAETAVIDEAEYSYLVGPQDVLSIIVWEHPELTIPAGGQRPAEVDGHKVGADGRIFYPYVGEVEVAGKDLKAIRDLLTSRLSRYIKNPQLDVRVVAFNSQKVYLSGEVAKPGVVPITDVPLTLASAVTSAGGATERGDLHEVVVTRGGERRSYNLQALYNTGDRSQDVVLDNGDIVYVPVNTSRKVYVMGPRRSACNHTYRFRR